MIDRVGDTGVFSNALVCEIYLAVGVYGNVLKKGIPLDGVVDIRLALFVEVDDLCIAAAFIVEYAVVIPAVFVVTDEETFRVGGKGCLACSGKSEEDG